MDANNRLIAAAVIVLAEMLHSVAQDGETPPGEIGGPFGPADYGLAQQLLRSALRG